MNGSPFAIQLPVYEGPMDLLLFVVRQRELDLFDVSLSAIAKDFMEYARSNEDLDLDEISEVFFITALLIYMKTKRLLPDESAQEEDELQVPGDREDMEEAYREIVAAAQKFAEQEEIQRKHFTRGSAAGIVELDENEEILRDVSLLNLAEAFRDTTRRMDKPRIRQLTMFKVTIEEQTQLLINKLKRQSRLSFQKLTESFSERIEAVVAFLSLLQLIRNGKVLVKQRGMLGEIWIYRGAKFSDSETNGTVENKP